MKLFDFTNKNLGWPYSANTFQFVQEQLLQLQVLSMLGGSCYVVSGCNNVGGIVQNGWVVINGEILPFMGGSIQTNVVIVPVPTTASFGDPATGATPVIATYSTDRYATFGTGSTQYAWSTFENKDIAKGVMQRLREAESDIATLDTNLTNLTVAFNLYQPDWTDITNKPVGLISHTGRANIGNVAGGTGQEFTITIPDQTNTNYRVIGNLVYLSGSYNNANTFCVVSDFKSPTQFKIWVREFEEADQNLAYDYIIVKI